MRLVGEGCQRVPAPDDPLQVPRHDRYALVLHHLVLSVLQSVDVERFDRGALSLRVTGRGDAAVLARVLALGGVLSAADLPGPSLPANTSAVPGSSLVFRVAHGATQ